MGQEFAPACSAVRQQRMLEPGRETNVRLDPSFGRPAQRRHAHAPRTTSLRYRTAHPAWTVPPLRQTVTTRMYWRLSRGRRSWFRSEECTECALPPA